MEERLEERLQQMLDGEIDESFVSFQLKNEVRSQLFPYQHFHIRTLVSAYQSERVLVDGSDTGTGKTYVASALCRQLDLKPVVICPKTVTNEWRRVLSIFGVHPLAVANYELIRNSKVLTEDGKAKKTTLISWNDKNGEYVWKLPTSAILICDEAHRGKNPKSKNGLMLRAVRKIPNKTLLLSATLCDSPSDFKLFGLLLGFYNDMKQANNWIKGELMNDRRRKRIDKSSLSKNLYPKKGSCMLISDLGDQFPENQITATGFNLDDKNKMKEINKGYQRLIDLKGNGEDILGEIVKERRRIETAKIDVLVDLAREYLENEFSIAIFVNFKTTLKSVRDILRGSNVACSLIYGGQDLASRERNIKKFQDDVNRVIICNIKAGGESISLHDVNGNYRRVSLISPSFSAIELQQALGRIHRAGSKSPALQRVVLISGSYEERIRERLHQKLKFGKKLTDDDLTDGLACWKKS